MLLLLSGVFLLDFRRDFLSRSLSAVLFSAEKRLLAARLAKDGQWRFPASGKLPLKYLLALLVSEDQRFFWHRGVDLQALIRALYLNLKHGRKVSGGSTITMQLVRIWRQKPRTYLEKLKEILYALRLELFLSKEKILQLYAANAPFGGNVVGLDAASWLYFQRPPEDLTWAESALFAVLPNNPAGLHPGKNRQALLRKRDQLLKKLYQKKIISALEYKLALAEELPERQHPPSLTAIHLLDTLLVEKPQKRPVYQTYVRWQLQQSITGIVENYSSILRNSGIQNASCLVIDNQKAEIVAYVGNSGLKEEQLFGQFVDIAVSPRSSGSILKPLLYAAMLDAGELTPQMLVPDIPSHFRGLIVENFDRSFRGAVPAYRALADSLNVAFVQLLKDFSVARFYNHLLGWRLTTITRSVQNYGLSLILGGAEVKLLEIAQTYSKLAQLAAGKKKIITPRILQNEELKINEMSNISSGAAYLTMTALSQVNRPGQEGFWRNYVSAQKIAFKTGTSYGLRDAWAVGCNPFYTVAVWVGNADGKDHPELTGISKAAPLMLMVFNTLDRKEWFGRPEEKLKAVRVCRQSGYLATELCPAVWSWLPVNSSFSKLCPYHQLIHLDEQEKFRVDSRCYPVSRIKSKSWFILPPAMEYFYQRFHAEYRRLPLYSPDCRQYQSDESEHNPLNLIYPQSRAIIFLPVNIDGQLSAIVLKAVHRHPEKTIFWYLDQNYLAKTTMIHELQIQPGCGVHTLILVDEDGNRVLRQFRVEQKGQ